MKKKNDLIVVIILIATILVLGYLIYFNIKKNTKVEINASIKETGNNYVVIVDNENNEYILNTDNVSNYDIGDQVNVTIKNIKKGSPNTCDVIKIDTISKSVAFSITDIPEEKNTEQSENENNTNNKESNSNTNSNNQSNTTTNSEANMINYFNTFSNEIDKTTDLKSSIKEKFVKCVDFIFYDGEINGKTFKELSTSAKLKVLQIFLKIDNKIEEKFPNYKQSISSTGNKVYTNVKSKALELYFNLTTDVCENDPKLCETAKDGLRDLKESFSLTWEFIKNTSEAGLSKLKSWYEIWREI